MNPEDKKISYYNYLIEMCNKFFDQGFEVLTILNELEQLTEKDVRIMESKDLNLYSKRLDEIVSKNKKGDV